MKLGASTYDCSVMEHSKISASLTIFRHIFTQYAYTASFISTQCAVWQLNKHRWHNEHMKTHEQPDNTMLLQTLCKYTTMQATVTRACAHTHTHTHTRTGDSRLRLPRKYFIDVAQPGVTLLAVLSSQKVLNFGTNYLQQCKWCSAKKVGEHNCTVWHCL